MSLYKNESERIADVLAANTSPYIHWRRTDSSDRLSLCATNDIERSILEIDAVEAEARLAINDAMCKQNS
jgi:hypothetical protein